ncbi:alpha/beta hydrolase [Bacillus oleivorans]|uniref:alpha/beta hydrolase n=1 Tax=Bacillus oleivorans TaxID=1448271 RepID=UPI003CCBA297
MSHGEHDPIFPIASGQANHDFFKQLGADVTYKEYSEGHAVSLQNYQDFIEWIYDRLEKGLELKAL